MMSRLLAGLTAFGVVTLAAAAGAQTASPSVTTFNDCATACPAMVIVPAGTFKMGMKDYDASQKPVHKVAIARPFAVSRTEVTFGQWDACVSGGGCKPAPDDGASRGDRPAVHISWDMAQAYIAWLSATSGHAYRLLSESEWEYAARIGLGADGFGTGAEAMDNATPNRLGLVGMYAAPNEWVADCYVDDYNWAAPDGSAYDEIPCTERGLRGGLKFQRSPLPRATFRQHGPHDYANDSIGFRVARDM